MSGVAGPAAPTPTSPVAGRGGDGAPAAPPGGASPPLASGAPRLGEPLITADDVARHLGVDRATVYRLAGRPGGIPVIEVAPRVRRFRVSDVLAFVAAKTVKPPPRTRGGRHLFGGAA